MPQVFKEDKYLKEATECAEVIWLRGLLRKGYGICHGTAGNAYAFLSLYKLTQEKKHLYRSCKVRPPASADAFLLSLLRPHRETPQISWWVSPAVPLSCKRSVH